MKLKLVSVALFALGMAAGAATAQTSSSGNTDAAPKIFQDPTTMKPFFTDDTMATLRSEEEVKAAFNALPAEQQQDMKSQCETATDPKYKDFCAAVGKM